MSKLDEILVIAEDVKHEKRQIKDLFLELVGEDADINLLMPHLPNIANRASGGNDVRAELRERIRLL